MADRHDEALIYEEDYANKIIKTMSLTEGCMNDQAEDKNECKINDDNESKETATKSVMDLFEEHERRFKEDVLFSQKIKSTCVMGNRRSRSRSPVMKTASGLEHLDNLVKILDQLSQLREQNHCLKRKCQYLENTKYLLYAHNIMLRTKGGKNNSPIVRSRFKSSRTSTRTKVLQHQHVSDGEVLMRQHACDTSDDEDHMEQSTWVKSGKIAKRSQSVGSIDVIYPDRTLTSYKSPGYSHQTGPTKNECKTVFSKSRFSSKWEKVKKVFGGKPETSTNRSETATISAEQLVRANSKSSPRPPSPQPQCVPGTPSDLPYKGFSTTPLPSSSKLLGLSNNKPFEKEPTIPFVIAPDSEKDGLPDYDVDSLIDPDSSYSNHSPSPFSDVSQVDTKFPIPGNIGGKSNFLTVQQTALPRRQSSPSLCTSDETDHPTKITQQMSPTPKIQRSSSFKVMKSYEGELDGEKEDPTFKDLIQSTNIDTKKGQVQRSPWGRVKEIIHTRKDSLKRKNRRSNSAGDMLPHSPIKDALCDRGSKSDVEDSRFDQEFESSPPQYPKSRRTECSTEHSKGDVGTRTRARIASLTSMDAAQWTRDSPVSPPTPPVQGVIPVKRQGSISPGTAQLDITSLIGGMSDEFNKRMQEWEEKKTSKRIVQKAAGSQQKSRSSVSQPHSPEVCTPSDQSGQLPSMEQLQKHLSESFSKTVQEWERTKTKRVKETGSPIQDSGIKGIEKRSRKQERSKSRERDRSRSKYDKQREKELHKIEKKELKIEKQKIKLEKMRQRLEGFETKSDSSIEGITQEFAKKLHEWEVMKGLRTDTSQLSAVGCSEAERAFSLSNPASHTRSHSAKAYKEYQSEKRDRTQSESKVDDMSFDNLSQQRKISEGSRSASVPSIRSCSKQLVDDSTSIDLNITNQDANNGDNWRHTLSKDIALKDEELNGLHHEVQQLTERITYMDVEHHKQIENYKRELWACSQIGRLTIETDLVEANLNELRGKVDQLSAYQGKLVNERNQLKSKIELELNVRQELEAKLVNHVRQLPLTSSTHQQAVDSVKDFDKLCDFFLILWSQLNGLRLGILERDQLLADMLRHILQQEVGNRLMAAELASHDLQLAYFKEVQGNHYLRRCYTMSGIDHIAKNAEGSQIWAKQYHAPNYYTLFSNAVSELQHGDIEAAPVDWEWLERLQAQRASAIGRIKSVADTDAPEAEARARQENRPSTNIAIPCHICGNAAQDPSLAVTSLRLYDQKHLQTHSSSDDVNSPNRISPASARSASYGPSSWSKKPYLVRQRAESSLSPSPSPVGKSNCAEAVFTFNLASSEQAGLVRITHGPAGCANTSPDMTPHDSSDGDSKMTEVGGPWIKRLSRAARGSTEFYPPPSPIIRSKNTRKLKTEFRQPQLNAETLNWKVTPPKRVRRRHVSTEQKIFVDEASNELENKLSLEALPPRGRAKVERFSVPQPRSLSVPLRDAVMYDLCFRDRGDPRDPGNQTASSSIDEKNTDMQINCCLGNRSPSPAIHKPSVSPLHRLKSATELINDSPHLRKGWHSAGNTRAVSPISSEIQNERIVSEDILYHSVTKKAQLRPLSSTGELMRETVRRLSESSCDVKPAHFSLAMTAHHTDIYDTHSTSVRAASVKAIPEGLGGRRGRTPGETPDQFIQTGAVLHHPVCDSITSIPEVVNSSTDVSHNLLESPPPRRHTLERTSPSVTFSGSARDLRRKLFGRCEKKGGAVELLCKQSVTLNIDANYDKPSTQRESETPTSRTSTRSRSFLDTNWFRKSRNFFKISK